MPRIINIMKYFREKVNLHDKRHFLSVIGTIIIFLSIPLTVLLVQRSREPTSRAALATGDMPPLDDSGPGSPLTGIATAEDNTPGSAGVAPPATICSYKVL